MKVSRFAVPEIRFIILLFSIFNSEMAASILSPPTNLDGLASEAFNAMFDFLIKKSN